MSDQLSAHGVSLVLPKGWDVEFMNEAAQDLSNAQPGEGGEVQPENPLVIHAGNFRLPPARGDFGSGAVETMGGGGVLVCLLEYGRESATTELFGRHSLPGELTPDMFQPHTLQRTIKGQSGTQIFCNEAGRAFCLYVVLGSHKRRATLVGVANEVVASIAIA